MTTNPQYTPVCLEPKAYGLIDWEVAVPALNAAGDTLTTLIELGTSVETTEFRNQPFYNEIYSDLHGGQQGPPIELQYLGHLVHFTIELTTWNETALELLRQRAFIVAPNADRGTVHQANIGQNMFLNHSVRVLANTAQTEDVRNFYCCIAREPMSVGYGTKWASWRIPMTAYRAPCYWPGLIGGVVEDLNTGQTIPT